MLWNPRDLTNVFRHYFMGHCSPLIALVWLGSDAGARGELAQAPPCIGRGVPCRGGHMLCDSKRKHCLSSLPWDSHLLFSCFCGVKCEQERKRNILLELTSVVRPQWSDSVVI